jgi:hypothetical protein
MHKIFKWGPRNNNNNVGWYGTTFQSSCRGL